LCCHVLLELIIGFDPGLDFKNNNFKAFVYFCASQ
jgi:hypothetical protein